MDTFFCIYSGKQWPVSERSEEHIVPVALGGSDEFVTYDVAKTVNSTMGTSIDAALADDIRVQLMRARLGLAGRSGRVPDLLDAYGTVADTGERVRCILPVDGPSIIRTFPRIQRNVDGKHISFVCSAADEARVLSDLRAKQGQFTVETRTESVTRNPTVSFETSFIFGSLQAAFVKMGIGTGHFALGDAWSASQHAARLRPQLSNPTPLGKDPARRVAVPLAAIAPRDILRLFSIGEDHHVLALLNRGGPLLFMGLLFGQLFGSMFLSDGPWPACEALDDGGVVYVIECRNRVLRPFTLLGFVAAREQGAWGDRGIGADLGSVMAELPVAEW